MSGPYWDDGARAYQRQQLDNPYSSSAITYEAPIYTPNEAPYAPKEPYHIAHQRDTAYAYRPSDIAVPPSMARGPSYERDSALWNTGLQGVHGETRAHSNSASDVGPLDGQHVWRNVHHYSVEPATQLPLTPVTAGSSDIDIGGQSRRSAAGKERKKASAVTRKCRPASCTPCRTKKMRCSRSKPCTACVNRGDPDGCLWEGDAVPLYTANEEDEVTKLQAHVKNLEAMIAALPPAKERFPVPKSRQPSPRAQVNVPPTQQPSSECYDLTAQDLAGALLSLITAGTVAPARAGQDSFLPDGQSSRGLLAECTALVATPSKQSGRDPFVHAAAATTPPMSTPTPDGLLALVPPERDLRIAYNFYRAHIAPFCFSVNHDEIEARWPRMKAILDAHDSELFVEEFEPQFFAVVLATCAFGLVKLPDALAQQQGLVGDRQAEAARWVRSATVFLEFPTDVPTLDGIRAATVLGIVHMTGATGTLLSKSIRMFSFGASAAMELGLNRDPLEGTLRECEEHRRIFWALFILSINATSTTGKTWPIFDLRYVDCAFPQEFHEDELDLDERAANARLRARQASPQFIETWITNQTHHFKIAYLAKATYDEVFAARSCSYDVVLEQDKKFVEVEAALPEPYQFRGFIDEPQTSTVQRGIVIHSCYSTEIMRLHRPFLSLAAIDKRFEYSRARCVEHARRSLYLYRLGWLSSFLPRFHACICILLDLMSGRVEERAEDLERIREACAQLDAHRFASPLHDRGWKILNYLLDRAGERGP